MAKIRVLSIHLPQFHPIHENNIWWGDGFTEWTNVKKSSPLFHGHFQPKVPHPTLGYYDLSDPEVLVSQSLLASAYGVTGFAFYHYWFCGKRLLNLPIDNMLSTGKPEFPFCLFWANETWSRRWLGEEKEILIKQTYSRDDDYEHINFLIQVFRDPRYIKVNGRPVFIIYRPLDLPHPAETLKVFTDECVKAGLGAPYFIGSNSHSGDYDLRKSGFDNILNFEPQLGVLPDYFSDRGTLGKLFRNIRGGVMSARLKIYDYSYAKGQMNGREFSYPYLPCSCVNWDNSPRRGSNGIIFKNGSPELFKKYLQTNINHLKKMHFSDEENFIFINAWNEWAEGNYLEPDTMSGFRYLEALKEILGSENDEQD
jgi:hypothetical protein